MENFAKRKSIGSMRAAIALVAGLALIAVCPTSSGAAERRTLVSNAAELNEAVLRAAGGDVLELEGGAYGALKLEGLEFEKPVTIRAADRDRPASFDWISVRRCKNLRLEKISVSSRVSGDRGTKLISIANSAQIAIEDSDISGTIDGTTDFRDYLGHFGVYARDVSDLRLHGNYVHDVRVGILVISGLDIEISENKIDYIGSDAINVAGSHGVAIVNNSGPSRLYAESSAHKDFIQFGGGDSSNIVIRGNVYLAGTELFVQGIFMDDAVFDHVLIEDNIIYTGILRGISLTAGTDVTIRNNTVLNVPESGHKATVIVGPPGAVVVDNIMGAKESRLAGSNIVLGSADCRGALCYRTTYRNAGVGLGVTLADLEPIPGGPADPRGGKGAGRRYLELTRSE